MSCPLCGDNTPSRAKAARVGDPAGDRCTCSNPDATSILIDPEEYDASEEQFAASLNSVASGTLHARGSARQEQHHAAQEARDFVLAGAVPVAHGMAAAQVTWNEGDEGSQQVDQGAFWRDEVSSRLENYRSRRRRPVRERSLPLDFERAVNREMTTGSLSASVAEDEECRVPAAEYPEPSTEYEANEDLAPAAEIVPVEMEEQAESNLIQFPRLPLLPVTPPSFEELAESMIGRPRILDVPEEVESRAPLADISVAPEEESAVEFELPLLVAPMSRRVFAGLADASIVLAAAGVFVTIVSRTGVPTPRDKTAFLLALVVPSLFWAIYEYLFLVYAGTTPGMQFARLQLVTFDGERVRRRSRRARALTMALSSLSLGLGLIWALLDEDTLCWHDRITRTYVVARGA
jgi:uncharacterized RDD family membrane protein YckC